MHATLVAIERLASKTSNSLSNDLSFAKEEHHSCAALGHAQWGGRVRKANEAISASLALVRADMPYCGVPERRTRCALAFRSKGHHRQSGIADPQDSFIEEPGGLSLVQLMVPNGS